MSSNYQGKRVARTRRTLLLFVVVAAVLALTAAFLVYQKFWRHGPVTSDQPPGSGAVQSGSASAPLPPQQPDVPKLPETPPYDFSQPVPEGEPVDNSYFDDAAFVGDSRTDGFMLYSGIGTGDNLSANGVSIFKLADRKSLVIDGEKYTALEALALKRYGKVYIALGINELGYNNDEGFYQSYCGAIDEIRRIQPNAVIYIQGLIPVNESQAASSTGKDYFKNDHLRTYNDLMRQAAEEKQVVYLDVYSEFVDENGALPEDASRDGVHLYKESCQRWLAYLKTHTVDFDTLYPDGPPAVAEPEPKPAEPDVSTMDGSGQE
ncbi:GDSL-type esterase/lipase family protein [Oscillospiraceae bacterium 50-58]